MVFWKATRESAFSLMFNCASLLNEVNCYCIVLHYVNITLHCIALYRIVLYCIAFPFCIICVVLYYIVLYCIVLYCLYCLV